MGWGGPGRLGAACENLLCTVLDLGTYCIVVAKDNATPGRLPVRERESQKAWRKRKQGMLRTDHASCICICRRRQFDFTQTSPPQLWLFTRQKDKHHRPHAHRLNKLRVASHCCFLVHDFTFSFPTDIQQAVSFAFDLASRRAFTPSGRSSKAPRRVQHKPFVLDVQQGMNKQIPTSPFVAPAANFLS